MFTGNIYEIFTVINLSKPRNPTSTISRVFWFTQTTSESCDMISKGDKYRGRERYEICGIVMECDTRRNIHGQMDESGSSPRQSYLLEGMGAVAEGLKAKAS